MCRFIMAQSGYYLHAICFESQKIKCTDTVQVDDAKFKFVKQNHIVQSSRTKISVYLLFNYLLNC